MSTIKPKLVSLLFLIALPGAALTARADVCNDAWAQAQASQTCEITSYSGITTGPPLNPQDPGPLCSFSARCKTGRSVPQDSNNWNSPQVTEWNNNQGGKLPPGQLQQLYNCKGELRAPPCP